MSFLFRPTPVVRLGRGPFASQNVLSGWTGATMRGIPAGASALGKAGPTGAVSRMRRVDTRLQPWIQSSGTMHGFMPAGLRGLGQDDGSAGIDWSSFDPNVSPIIPPALNTPDLVPPDFASPSFSPTFPALISPTQAPAPAIPSGFYSGASAQPIVPSSQATTLPPAPQAAGPTGSGIPGTQPANLPVASQAPSLITAITGSIKSFLTPTPATPAYTQLPGYSSAMVASPASWFSQASIIQGVPNAAVLGIALIGIVALGGAAAKARR